MMMEDAVRQHDGAAHLLASCNNHPHHMEDSQYRYALGVLHDFHRKESLMSIVEEKEEEEEDQERWLRPALKKHSAVTCLASLAVAPSEGGGSSATMEDATMGSLSEGFSDLMSASEPIRPRHHYRVYQQQQPEHAPFVFDADEWGHFHMDQQPQENHPNVMYRMTHGPTGSQSMASFRRRHSNRSSTRRRSKDAAKFGFPRKPAAPPAGNLPSCCPR